MNEICRTKNYAFTELLIDGENKSYMSFHGKCHYIELSVSEAEWNDMSTIHFRDYTNENTSFRLFLAMNHSLSLNSSKSLSLDTELEKLVWLKLYLKRHFSNFQSFFKKNKIPINSFVILSPKKYAIFIRIQKLCLQKLLSKTLFFSLCNFMDI